MIPISNGRVTASFDEPRPLSNPGLHIHGALDIAPQIGGDQFTMAPVAGKSRAYVFIRPRRDADWGRYDKLEIGRLPARRYWYDVYGGLIWLEETGSPRVHIMTHYWAAQLQAAFGRLEYIESDTDDPYPCIVLRSDVRAVSAGDRLAMVGDAGQSSGKHVHWEVHPSADLRPHAERIDPNEYLE